jgi:dihydropteroate synthase
MPMPIVRLVAAHSEPLLALHLARLGASGPEARRALGRTGYAALVTGAAPEAIEALAAEGGAAVVAGDPDRARGAALIAAGRDELLGLAAALDARGPGAAALARAMRASLGAATAAPAPTQIGERRFEWGRRTYLMGIVNVTPDSFSDGGRYLTPAAAIAAGERLAADGADIIDVGGESTRPGAEPVPAEKEIDRVVPVIEALARRIDVPISIDTTKARVAEAAAAAGATMINDVSGFKFDVEMAPLVARLGLATCAMHLPGELATMHQVPTYFDLVGEVIEGLQASVEHAVRCGIARERIVIDPGLGFGKTADHNLFLLRNLGQLRCLGLPVLVGASRKRFIGHVTGRQVGDRLPGSLAVLSAAVLAGADIVRVHDVSESRAAAQMIDAIARAAEAGFAFQP